MNGLTEEETRSGKRPKEGWRNVGGWLIEGHERAKAFAVNLS